MEAIHQIASKAGVLQVRLDAQVGGGLNEMDADDNSLQVVDDRYRPQDLRFLPPTFGLPAELISEIFIQCSPLISSLPPRSNSLPWALCHVCFAWRHIALHTPRLWDNANLHPNAHFKNFDGIDLSKLSKIWFDRAYALPLTISINSNVSGTLSFFVPWITRIKDLSLSMTRSDLESFFALPAGSVASLEALELGIPYEFDFLRNIPISVFSDLPKLCRVTLSGVFDKPDIDAILALHIPWSQLTHLTLDWSINLNPTFCHSLLQLCTSLHYCSLWEFRETTEKAPVMRPSVIVLSHLRILSVTVSGASPFFSFIEPLFLPSLQELQIYLSCSLLIPSEASRNVLSRLLVNITRFTLINHVEETDLHLLLQLMSSLVELHCPDTVMPIGILDMLARRELLPKLESITVCVDLIVTGVQRSRYALIRMLKSRSVSVGHSDSRLRRVVLMSTTDGLIHPDYTEVIAGLSRADVVVDVQCPWRVPG